jgi:hypothetical protein
MERAARSTGVGSRQTKHNPLGPAALGAVSSLLAPVVPLLLELGVGIGDVETVLKLLYVQAAQGLVLAQGKEKSEAGPRATNPLKIQASIATLAMMTGLTRKAVARLLTLGTDRDASSDIGRQRAERVISGWLHDPDYRNERTGLPAILPLRGPPPSFTSLVKQHSGDPRVRTILTELRRVRAIRDHPGRKVELIRHSYAPSGLDPAAIALVGEQAADYIRTLVHNVKRPSWPLYSRRVVNARVDSAELGRLMRHCATLADSTMESFDAAINDPSASTSSESASGQAGRLGAGIFIFHDAPPLSVALNPGDEAVVAPRSRKRRSNGITRRGK